MAQKIKVLVCGVLPPPNFGHSMTYKMLMSSAFVQECDVVFLEMKFWSYAKHKKVTIDKILKMVKYWFQLVYAIVRHQPTFLLFNMSFDKMPFLKDLLFCQTAHILGCRVVLHDHGQYLPELYASSGGMMKKLIKHLLRITHAIIVMGEKVRAEYTPFYDPARIKVVPGGVEDTKTIATAPRIPDGRIKVLYFSYLSTTKGVWTALKAVPLVVRANPNIDFIFAGPAESEQLKNDMLAFIDAEKVKDHFTYVGYVEGVEERTQYFRNADIFIFPTLRDVFGLVIAHAMAEGLPVVASIEGTIPEILKDGTNGLLFPKGQEALLAQHILRLAADPVLRKTMGEANRRRYLDYYSLPVYGRNMIETFASFT